MSFFENHDLDLLKALPEALLITSVSGEILYVNHALEKLTDFTELDLVGEDVSALMPSGERQRLNVVTWFSRWAESPDSEQLRHLSLDGVTKTGKKLRLRVRVSAFHEGSKVFFLVIIHDITEEYQSTLDLRHSQLVSNRIIAIGEDAVMTVDEDQLVRYWNKKAEEVFGYTSEEMLGKDFGLLIPENFSALHREQVKTFSIGTVASKLMGERSEIRGLHRDGHQIPLEASITKTTVDGRLLISAQIRDITLRKQAEAALREKESRFRAIFENAIEAMALLSSEGEILEFNSAASSLLATSDSPIGKDFWMLDWWGNNDEAARQNLKDTIDQVGQGEFVRIRAVLPAGEHHRDIDFSLKPVKDSGGDIQYIIAEGRDITNLSEPA